MKLAIRIFSKKYHIIINLSIVAIQKFILSTKCFKASIYKRPGDSEAQFVEDSTDTWEQFKVIKNNIINKTAKTVGGLKKSVH